MIFRLFYTTKFFYKLVKIVMILLYSYQRPFFYYVDLPYKLSLFGIEITARTTFVWERWNLI